MQTCCPWRRTFGSARRMSAQFERFWEETMATGLNVSRRKALGLFAALPLAGLAGRAAAASEPVKVGLVLTMSGPFAASGQIMANAAKLYLETQGKALLGDVPVDSWDILFKPENAAKLKSCGINILDASDETFAIAMNYIGKNPDSKVAADLEAGGEVYKKIRPSVKTFNSSAYIDELANGDTCITIGWSGDILQAKTRAEDAKNGVNVNYVIPKEGTYMWFDNLAIPADAKNVEEAHAFINFLMKPEVIAKASNYVQYANGNLASQKFIDESVLKNPSVYPNEATLAKLFTISPYDPRAQRVINREWTAIKTGQ